MPLLDDLNASASLLTFLVTTLTAALIGSKVVYKFVQKRNLAILNRRIDNCFAQSIQSTTKAISDHGDRIMKLETKIDNIFEFFLKGRRNV